MICQQCSMYGEAFLLINVLAEIKRPLITRVVIIKKKGCTVDEEYAVNVDYNMHLYISEYYTIGLNIILYINININVFSSSCCFPALSLPLPFGRIMETQNNKCLLVML